MRTPLKTRFLHGIVLRVIAIVLSASLCLPMLPAEAARAAGGVTYTEEEQVFINNYNGPLKSDTYLLCFVHWAEPQHNYQ